jgi:hypothetical protein
MGCVVRGDGCKPGLIERRGKREEISLMVSVVDRFISIEWELFSRVEFICLCSEL